MRVTHHGELVAEIPNKALTDDAPVYHRPVGVWKAPVPLDLPRGGGRAEEAARLHGGPEKAAGEREHLRQALGVRAVRLDGADQYGARAGRRGGRDADQGTGARVARFTSGTRRDEAERGLAMALAGNGRWCWLDPKLGAMHAVAEAARKVACTGALRWRRRIA